MDETLDKIAYIEVITILLMEIIALFLAVCFGYQLAQAIGDIDQGGSAAVRTLCAPDYDFFTESLFVGRL